MRIITATAWLQCPSCKGYKRTEYTAPLGSDGTIVGGTFPVCECKPATNILQDKFVLRPVILSICRS